MPNVVAVHLVMAASGVGVYPRVVLQTARQILPTLIGLMIAGVAVRAVYELLRSRSRRYLRAIGRPSWLLGSLVLALAGALTVHGYSYLKLMVPLLHHASFDRAFWEIDRLLFFGLSPSVFLLTLFSSPRLLRAIDWSYVQLYYPVLLGFLGLFLSLRSNRLRFAIASGFTGMWLAGAWLYLAFPALGPCYAVSAVWDHSRELLAVSHLTQIRLMENYVKVLRIPEGVVAGISPSFGIAAFPSLHVASQLYAALWVRRLSRPLGFALLLSVAILFVGTIVTGWHYLVDSLAGLAMAWGAYRLSARAWGLERWRRSGSVTS